MLWVRPFQEPRTKFGEVLEHPVVLLGVIDDFQELAARQGHVSLASSAVAPESTLRQRGAFELVPVSSLFPCSELHVLR